MKKIIFANWKLNPTTLKDAQKLAAAIDRKPKHKVVICPPTIFLSQIDYPNLGAQDCFWQEKGPHTGQTSPAQLKSLGVKCKSKNLYRTWYYSSFVRRFWHNCGAG